MAIEIKAPVFPESVADGTIATWHKKAGEFCKRDELLVDIETDKVVLEIVAPVDGVLQNIIKQEGDVVLSEEVIGVLSDEVVATESAPSNVLKQSTSVSASAIVDTSEDAPLSPAARKAAEVHGVDPSGIAGSGKNGRVTKEDIMTAAANVHQQNAVSVQSTERVPTQYVMQQPVAPASAPAPAPASVSPLASTAQHSPSVSNPGQVVLFSETGERIEKRVPMTRLRQKVAQRLVEAQQTAAMLTTFNEVNMEPVMTLRARSKEAFEKRHGVRLGFMSFFVKACVEALKRQPGVNASIDGNDIVYHGYQDVGVAVSSERGLVVPVLRNTENMGLADIESQIRTFGQKAKDGKLTIDEMMGGTFTISNGGVFGSLLSTPILNPPQSAILGMHKIQDRPVVIDGEIVIRPMMYLALSYDHRLLDGKEAVTFLVTIKGLLEDPARILLDI